MRLLPYKFCKIEELNSFKLDTVKLHTSQSSIQLIISASFMSFLFNAAPDAAFGAAFGDVSHR